MTTVSAAICSNCGTSHPRGETVDGVTATTCPNCGGVSVTIQAASATVRGWATAPSVSMTQETTAATRLGKVQAAIDRLAEPDRQAHLDQALELVMAALEGMHQLEDARKRGEWSNAHWSSAEVDLWNAHLGARNGAHHKDWTPIWWYSDGSGSGERWSRGLPRIRSAPQRAAYSARLENKAVLPSLHAICALLAGAI